MHTQQHGGPGVAHRGFRQTWVCENTLSCVTVTKTESGLQILHKHTGLVPKNLCESPVSHEQPKISVRVKKKHLCHRLPPVNFKWQQVSDAMATRHFPVQQGTALPPNHRDEGVRYERENSCSRVRCHKGKLREGESREREKSRGEKSRERESD